MKVLVIVLALVAMACAYDVEDISPVMRDRLDRFVDMTQRWHSKWTTMTLGEQQHYEQVLLARLEELPKVEIQRLRHRIEALSPEKRLQLVQFLARRFQIENIDKYDNEIDAINGIVQALPEYARERIRDMIRTGFQEASAFAASDDEEGEEFEETFPDIPAIVDIPVEVATAYMLNIPESIRERLDDFLLTREDWKRKWERLSVERREAFEKYIKEKME